MTTIVQVVDGRTVVDVSGPGSDMARAAAAEAQAHAAAAGESAEAADTFSEAAALYASGALVLSNLYASTAIGLAAVAEGGFFGVPGTGDVFATLYQDVGGVAVQKESFPSIVGLRRLGSLPAIATGVEADQAATINALLADPNVNSVVLPEGIIWVNRSIQIPSGKTLRGQGRGRTTVKALPTFNPATITNGVVCSALNATDVGAYDFKIDASKLLPGGVRITGLFMRQARGFSVARVDVYNTTGYGHFAQGDANAFSTYASGSYEDCRSYNCQIHFEQMTCDGVTLYNCHGRDGDGDIPCASYFHPLTGAKNITAIACSGKGAAFTAVETIANLEALENIRYTDCDFHVSGAVPCVVASGALEVNGFYLTNCRIRSEGGRGLLLSRSTGTIVQCTIEGESIGAEFANDSHFSVTETDVLGFTDPGGAAAAFGVNVAGGSTLRWNGGTIEASGPPGAMFPISGTVDTSSHTLIVPPSPGGGGSVKREVFGQVVLNAVGVDSFTPSISLGFEVLDQAKTHVDVMVLNPADAVMGGGVSAPLITSHFVDDGTIRIWITGGNLGGKTISYRFLEWD